MIECLTMASLKKEAQAFKDHDRQWNTIHMIEPETKTAEQRKIEFIGWHDKIPPKMQGKIFGKLAILDSKPVSAGGYKSFWVRCACGSPGKLVRWSALRSGTTKSCGCTRGRNKYRGSK